MKRFKKVLSILMCAAMLVNYMPSIAFAADGTNGAGQSGLEPPKAEKVLTPNDDGTYDLSLSVTGTASTETETSMADVIIVFDKSYSMTYSAGWRKTRMSVAKPAVKTLIDSLLAKNQKTAGAVKVGLVSFGSTATVDSQLSDNSTSLKNIVENYNTNAPSGDRYNYTNWEDALQKVQAIETRSGAKKYVIFVSDGNPTVYVGGGAKNETDSNVNNCFNHAKDDAQALAKKGYKFYGVGAFGDATRMQNLVKEAGGTGDLNDDYFDASDEAALIAAFANIIESITTTIDYEKVKITDGVTGLTSMAEVNGKPGNFTYTKTDKNGTTTSWTDAPVASFSNGKVTWDLSKVKGQNFALEDGVKYTVTFTVWPSQRAYDITAALNDGLITYGDTSKKLPDGTTVSKEEWSQFDPVSGNLYTNTEAKVDYTAFRDVDGTKEIIGQGPSPIPNPDPVPLKSAKMYVEKKWDDSMTSGEDRPDEVELVIMQDGEEFETVTLTKADNWKAEITIAPGILATLNEAEGAKGHEYTLKEPDIENHYELSNVAVRPMVYDNEQHLEDLDNPEGDSYHKWKDGDAILTATNIVKGGINISKSVYKDVDGKLELDTADKSKFSFKVELKKGGKPVSTPEGEDSTGGNLGYRIYNADGSVASRGGISGGTVTLEIDQTQSIRIVNVPKGTSYTVTELDAEGYELITSKTENTSGTIKGNDKADVKFANKKEYGDDKLNPVSIKINKLDAKTGHAIPATDSNHAVFTVYSDQDCKTAVGTTTLNKDGKLEFEFVKDGTYYIKETKAPNGYALNPAVQKVVVSKTPAATPEELIDGVWVKVFDLKTGLANNTYTVSDTPDKTQVTVTKKWNDQEIAGKYQRPQSIDAVLIGTTSSGAQVYSDTKALSQSNSWSYTWSELAATYDGEAVTYKVNEVAIPGFKVEVKGSTITNTPETKDEFDPVKIFINKTDANTDKSLVMSDNYKAVFEVKDAEGTSLGYTDVVDGKITFTFTKAGNYTLKEVAAPDGYKVNDTEYAVEVKAGEIKRVVLNGNIFEKWWSLIAGISKDYDAESNTLTVADPSENIEIPVIKVWEDNDDQDGIRPESITVELLADGKAAKDKDGNAQTVTLSESNKWTDKFTELPKRVDGKVINYSVKEIKVEGYDCEITGRADAAGFTITNTHETEKTSKTVTKIWKDNNDQDGFRASYGVTLFAGEEAVGPEVTLNKDQLTYTWKNLDKYKDGKEIQYTVKETTVPAKYEASVDGMTITNKHVPEVTEQTVTKKWEDNNNQDGKRASYGVTLYKQVGEGGEKIKVGEEVILDAETTSHTWPKLPVYEGGKKITYSVDETKVPAEYQKSVDGFTITNSYTPKTVEKTVTKKWVDDNDRDGLRDKYAVTLYADGKQYGQVIILDKDQLTYTWPDLPMYANGTPIVYTVDETGVPSGYTKTVEGMTITNTHIPETTSQTVQKRWNDNDDQDGLRAEYGVTLFKKVGDGEKTAVGAEVKLSKDQLTYTWPNLPVNEGGKKITYSVEETTVPRGYEASYAGMTVINTHKPETTTKTFHKIWDDSNNQDGLRGEYKVQLLADGEAVEGSEVTLPADTLTHTWNDLPKYKDGGKEIIYSVKETKVPEGYGATEDGLKVTNKHTPSVISKTVEKEWNDNNDQDGMRAEYGVTLYKQVGDGEKTAVGAEVKLSKDQLTYTWPNLPEFEGGKKINYTVEETTVPEGYEASVIGMKIVNTHKPVKVEKTFHKIWNDNNNQDGLRDEYKVQLLADGEAVEGSEVTLPADTLTYTWNDLDKYKDGKEIKYTVEETKVPEGYGAKAEGLTVTNTHKPETISKTVTKDWDDNGNQDGLRGKYAVTLYADGNKYDTVELNKDQLTHTWNDLPKYKDGGKEIVYTVDETLKPDGYTKNVKTTEDGNFEITNKHESEKTSISGRKDWDDAGDQDGKRPSKIVINLLKDGMPIDSKEVTAADNWEWTFDNLYKYENEGQLVKYSFTEEVVADYSTKYLDNNVIKNSYTPGKTSVSVAKAWDDNNDQDGKRPGSITVQLVADGTPVDGKTIVLSDNNSWKGSFTELPEKKAGKKIEYTVKELNSEGLEKLGYKSSITGSAAEGFTITNLRDTEKTVKEFKKIWNDNEDQDGLRADYTVQLLKDGEACGDEVKLDKKTLSYTWTNLEKYRDHGTEIVYSVRETKVPAGYKAEAVGLTITNTHTPETVDISGTKNWNDDAYSNIPGYERPKTLTVKLLADGKEVASKEISKDDNWNYEFKDMPKYAKGKVKQLVNYTVDEVLPDGYTKVVDGYKIQNTPNAKPNADKVLAPLPLNIKKVDAATGNEISGAEFTIYKLNDAGEVVGDGIKVNGNSSFEFDEVDDAGSYKIVETKAPSDYKTVTTKFELKVEKVLEKTAVVDDVWVKYYSLKYTEVNPEDAFSDVDGTKTLTVEDPSETIDISVTKDWQDSDNQDGVRPESITVQLLADGKAAKDKDGKELTVTLSKSNNWTDKFTDLPKRVDGNEIEYTVQEIKVESYDCKITGDASKGFTITNTHKPSLVDIPVTKVWNDEGYSDIPGYERPESIKVQLLADGTVVDSKEISKADRWNYTFKDKPEFKDGEKINYTVDEILPAGFSKEIADNTIENTPKTNVDPDKDVVIPLPLNIKKVDAATGNAISGSEFTVTKLNGEGKSDGVTVDGNTVYDFTDEGTYRIVESKNPRGYDKVDTEFTVKIEKILDETKLVGDVWVKYYSLKYTEVTPKDAFSDVDGKKTLTVEDPSVTTEVSVSKIWKNMKAEGAKKASFEVTLYANGKAVKGSAHKMSANESTYTWKNLPKYEDGKLIDYSVKETKVPKHFKSSTEQTNAYAKNGKATITNTYEGVPNTGDNSNLLVEVFAFFGSLMSGAALLFARRKRNNA